MTKLIISFLFGFFVSILTSTIIKLFYRYRLDKNGREYQKYIENIQRKIFYLKLQDLLMSKPRISEDKLMSMALDYSMFSKSKTSAHRILNDIKKLAKSKRIDHLVEKAENVINERFEIINA